MAETYRISAVPMLFSEGEYEGKLKGVTFTAISAGESREWFTRNCGQFETSFGRIMQHNLAGALAAALMHGDAIELPGEYHATQFERGFMYEWSPVYFVLPPREYSF
jgi:hypothetical protein